MKREETMQILQIYKDELGQRIDKADDPDLKDVYQWQMDGFDMAIESLQGDMYCPNCGVRLVPEDEYLEPTQTHGRLIDADALMEYCSNQKTKTISNNDIARFPTAQADRPHGEWIFRTDIPIGGGRESAGYVCSNCRKDYFHVDGMNFCPNCGCVMDMRGADK